MFLSHVPPAASAPTRLLLVACSARKTPSIIPIPAWDLYDGPWFRVLKRSFRTGGWPDDLDLLILSARHGILAPHEVVVPYDEVMTPERAMAIRHTVHARLSRAFHARPYRELLVVAGKAYLQAIRLSPIWLPSHLSVQVASGGIGRKLHQLRLWLE